MRHRCFGLQRVMQTVTGQVQWSGQCRRSTAGFAAIVLALGVPAASAGADKAAPAAQKIDFTREIRPILANHCWNCHGPDEKQRKAGLRLDLVESSRTKLESGFAAIVPGNPDESELVARIAATDDAEVMPPPSAKKPLSAQQTKLLR